MRASGKVDVRGIFAKVVLPTTALLLLCERRGYRVKVRNEVVRYRLAWKEHAKSLRSESQFKRYYRMSHDSFEKLLAIVSPFLEVDETQALRRTSGRQPLSKAGQLQACLRWLAGGSALDLRIITGVSKSSFYRIIHRVMDAINTAAELSLKFPMTPSEVKSVAQGFAVRSTDGVIQGCFGAIDGWLCPIRVPRKNECGRVDSFYSGHYHQYGLNVQACVDSESRFTAYTVNSPGGMNDALAFRKWALSDLIDRAPEGFFVVGDNAYTQSIRVMTPYNTSEIKDRDDRDSYNFYLSQLRIRVEMAFGLLVNKWRILKSPLTVKLSACAKVIGACIRLHNFCVSERVRDGRVDTVAMLTEVRQANEDRNISYPETIVHEDDDMLYGESASTVFAEVARNNIVEHIASMNMFRPVNNLARRAAEEAERNA